MGLHWARAGWAARGAANTKADQYVLPLAFVELAVMVLSALGLVLTVIVWVVVAAIGDRGEDTPGTTRLFDDSDKGNDEP